jgi:hypothetical protein
MEYMKIMLTPDLEHALAEQANKQGTTPKRGALDYLRERFLPPDTTEGKIEEQGTLADFLANHIGVLSSSEYVPGGAHMSENRGSKFTAGLVEKRRKGRL